MTNGESGRYPWFPFYPADFLTDENVVMMAAAEVGLYVQLLCHAWKEGSIPDSPRTLARLGRVTEAELADLWPAVAPCFLPVPEQAGRLYNPRLEREREKLAEKSQSARKSAEARWNPEARTKRRRGAAKPPAAQQVMRTHSGGNATQQNGTHAGAQSGVQNGVPGGSGDAGQGAAGQPVMRTHSERNANGMLSESDITDSPKGESGRGRARGRSPRKRSGARKSGKVGGAVAMPADFAITEEHRNIAQAEGLHVERELETMRDWAEGEGAVKLNWNATFRNWLRRSGEKRREKGLPPYVEGQPYAVATSRPVVHRDPGAWEDSEQKLRRGGVVS